MEPSESLIANIERFITLTDDEREYLTAILRVTAVRKKQYVCQPEFVCRYRSYVFSGSLRSYFVDANGQEHTISLVIEDWWVSDFYSYT
ncbi:MAG: Crp/Fnr family transcriptional regulator, partial [Bacteroidetes bacterium]|nr:Crp/Fnr family transcriptional regulator [Bacteroidota bacterium]